MHPSLTPLVEGLRPVGLAELEATAALLEREDRKYLLGFDALAALLEALAGTHAALEIDGNREFEYRTTYYDTAGLVTYRDHVQRRRRRFKARAREYLDSGDCAFEVKVRGARGRTIKHRMGYEPELAETLTEPALTFLLACLQDNYAGRLDERLFPTLTTTYRRMTFVAPELTERLTCDFGLVYAAPGGARGRMVDGIAIVESKSRRGAARADQVLKGLGVRPEKGCSKYCLGIGLTRPDVKSNAFRHLLRRHFTALPGGAVAAAAALALALPFAAPSAAEADALPRVSITAPAPIVDDPKVTAAMHVRARRGGYRGEIGIEHRGQLSQVWPKKSFSVETRTRSGEDRDVRLLGMPGDADWNLQAVYADRSLMRDALAYATARRLGGYAPRTRFVELELNGAYQGVYVLTEQLEIDKRRIRWPDKTMLLELTQDYQLDPGDEVARGPLTGWPVKIADAGDKISDGERRRANVAVNELELAFGRPAPSDWRRWLDERSAVDYILIQELFRNEDALWASTHMRLGPRGPLRLGPVWDFDLSSGSAYSDAQMSPEGWRTVDRPWGKPLLTDPAFMRAFAGRWQALRRDGLVGFLQRSIRRNRAALEAPAARNFATWNVLTHPVSFAQPVRASHAEETAALWGWLDRRVAWMDATLRARR